VPRPRRGPGRRAGRIAVRNEETAHRRAAEAQLLEVTGRIQDLWQQVETERGHAVAAEQAAATTRARRSSRAAHDYVARTRVVMADKRSIKLADMKLMVPKVNIARAAAVTRHPHRRQHASGPYLTGSGNGGVRVPQRPRRRGRPLSAAGSGLAIASIGMPVQIGPVRSDAHGGYERATDAATCVALDCIRSRTRPQQRSTLVVVSV
jgi:hypothetical protein